MSVSGRSVSGEQTIEQETLTSLLGGGRGALDATVPVVGFVGGWLIGRSVLWGALTAVVVAAGIAGWRLRRGRPPRAVLIGLLAVLASRPVPLYTGPADGLFLFQTFTNAAHALASTLGILLRRP